MKAAARPQETPVWQWVQISCVSRVSHGLMASRILTIPAPMKYRKENRGYTSQLAVHWTLSSDSA